MSRRYVLGLGVALVAVGCAEGNRDVVAPQQASIAAEVDAVARAIALGMAQPAARLAVRDAMRMSPLTEHKLSLREFANSAAGEELIRAGAAATGVAPGELRARIAGLPDLDFYVPARQQRLTWEGGADYVVAVSLDKGGTRSAYRNDGKTRSLDLWRDLPHETVFFVQSAETKSVRVIRQAGPGATIQDPTDGELSGTVVLQDQTGLSLTIGLAEWQRVEAKAFQMQCYEDCGGGGGGGGTPPPPPPPPPQTFLENLNTFGVYDNNNPFETNEFEFRAMTPNGTTEAIRIEGIPHDGYSLLHIHLIYALPPMWVGGEGGTIAARETDGWPNPDDKWYFVYAKSSPESGTACGAIPLGSNVEFQEDKGRYFPLREDKCYNASNLVVNFTWP